MTPISTRDLIKIGKMADIMGLNQATHLILEGIAKPTDEAVLSKMVDTHISEGNVVDEDQFGSI